FEVPQFPAQLRSAGPTAQSRDESAAAPMPLDAPSTHDREIAKLYLNRHEVLNTVDRLTNNVVTLRVRPNGDVDRLDFAASSGWVSFLVPNLSLRASAVILSFT